MKSHDISKLADPAAEASVLGGVLLRREVLLEIDLEAREFYDPRHREVYMAMRALEREGRPPDDLVLLEAELARRNKLEAIGGVPFLSELAILVPTAANIEHYVRRVRDRSQARRLYVLAGQLQSMALEGEEHEEIAAAAQRGLEEAILGPPPSTRRAVEVIDDIIADSKRPAIKTGFPKLDHRIKGFRLNTVNVLIGPTGGGKTSWALQTSSLISVNHPVIYGGLELTQSQLAARCLAQRLDIPWTEVLSGNFDPVKAREALEHLDLWFIAAGPNFLGAIERAISEAERRCPGVPILLVIDYVQLLAGEGDLRAATRSAALGIQRLTETRPVATLVLSQSSRANSKKMREGGAEAASEYIGAGLETGSIEHSAALQLVIEMPAENDVEESEGSMQIAKNRFGAQGAVGFAFAGATGTWRELDERPPSPKATRAQLRDTEDDEAVLAAIAKHPGRSWREIRPFAGVQGKRADLAKYRLLRSNRIEVKPVPTTRKDGRIINADAWFPVAEEDRY